MGEQPSETQTDRARLISHLSFSCRQLFCVGGGLNAGLKSYSRDLIHASKRTTSQKWLTELTVQRERIFKWPHVREKMFVIFAPKFFLSEEFTLVSVNNRDSIQCDLAVSLFLFVSHFLQEGKFSLEFYVYCNWWTSISDLSRYI